MNSTNGTTDYYVEHYATKTIKTKISVHIWRSGCHSNCTTASHFTEYNQGLPAGADYRQMRGMAKTPQNDLFAVSVMDLYKLGK